ncbi:hypothetical protein PSH87_12885 [Pseudomonas sp. FP453]|uniref:hypothetical protein n=1 Tax=Pseudomonas sp. FP453 TaxID=2954094 RepID=UPI002732BFF2|nr:hypothetical protein [Pseudomonas sp. FP453]WLH92801.1 hypothetical protein PSH87_12885 [Pseudomonas sp. FP453]
MARKNHLIVDSGCTQDNERWALSACGLNEDSEVPWDGTHKREFVSCRRCQAKMAKPRPAPEPFHKERPILFSGAMVRAILSGQKTVTRRLVKGNQIPSRSKSDSPEHQWIAVVQDHPRWGFAAFGATEQECAAELAMYGGCPYGRRGDRLWVREAWAEINVAQAPGESWVVYRECDNRTDYGGPWKPSIHMRHRDSRILLEITGVRVERLQDISEEQAQAEGIGVQATESFRAAGVERSAGFAFRDLWASTGGDWDANPWVWVVEFKRVTP